MNGSHMVLGFAFSLQADGSPGSYNKTLARLLHRYLNRNQQQSHSLPFVALQWEIADALLEGYPSLAHTLEKQQKLLVIEPPRFHISEINSTQLQSWLTSTSELHGKLLRDHLVNSDYDGQHSLIYRMNRLLDNKDFFRDFPTVSLSDLIRPKLGALFTEQRKMPNIPDYPDGLRRYQRVRINRLIIESVVNDHGIVKQGRYLSTAGVINAVLKYTTEAGQQFTKISIAAHPLHTPRCLEQANDLIVPSNLNIELASDIVDEHFPWESSGAQAWCQSLANWTEYEQGVRSFNALLNRVTKPPS